MIHDKSEALSMSDRIVSCKEAAIQKLAAPAELYERPQNAFVAQSSARTTGCTGRGERQGGGCRRAGNVQALAINVEAVGRPTGAGEAEPTRAGCGADLSGRPSSRVSVSGNDDLVVKLLNSEGVAQVEPGAVITIGRKTEDCRVLYAQ
ncbi:ABC-type sugar transport system ATPase subunit [Bradyrhizobium sp. RT6a]|uniref:hypothetical protein n=1 Tax=Bradyrhizobium sp. RT6a TaxID=3156381 RepID=UPI00339910C0